MDEKTAPKMLQLSVYENTYTVSLGEDDELFSVTFVYDEGKPHLVGIKQYKYTVNWWDLGMFDSKFSIKSDVNKYLFARGQTVFTFRRRNKNTIHITNGKGADTRTIPCGKFKQFKQELKELLLVIFKGEGVPVRLEGELT